MDNKVPEKDRHNEVPPRSKDGSTSPQPEEKERAYFQMWLYKWLLILGRI